MSDFKNLTRHGGAHRRNASVEPGALKPGALKHGALKPGAVKPGAVKPGAAAPRDLYKTGGRHGAITNTLYNFHSYKNWAEKIRGSWDEKK